MAADAIAGLAERLARLCERDGAEVLRPFERLIEMWEQRPARDAAQPAPQPQTQPAAIQKLLVAELLERGEGLLRDGDFTEAEATLLEAKRLNASDPNVFQRLAELFALRAEQVRAGLTADIPRETIPTELPQPPRIPRRRFGNSFDENPYFGPFEILRELGRGITHVVYLARYRDSCLDRKVALFVLLDQDPSNEDWRKSLKDLADNWLKIRHPGVLRLEDLQRIDDSLLYVVDYIEGGVLQPGIGVDAIASLLPQVCDALVAMEGAVYPGNILHGPQGPVIKPGRNGDPVAGFGEALAKLLGGEAQAGRDDVPAWLQNLIRRCEPSQLDRFPGAVQIREFVRFHLHPEESDRVQISITSVKGIQYETTWNGTARPQFSRSGAESPLIEGLRKRWREMGSLSLRRETRRSHENPDSDLDPQILAALNVIRDNSAMVLGRKLSDRIAQQKDCTFSLLHDPVLTGFPWEILGAPEPLCLRFPISRVPRLREGGMQRAVLPDRPLRVVLAGDESLKHCAAEIELLAAKFQKPGFETQKFYSWHGPDRLRQALSRCDIFHFAGHGYMSPDNPAANGPGIGDDILNADQLGDLWNEHAPLLVFANCCFVAAANDARLPWWLVGEGGQGFAHEVCQVGAANFIGSVLELPESERTIAFAGAFYDHLLGGRAVSHAMLEARRYCRDEYGLEDLTWARYILFGDPFTSIRTFSGKHANAAST